MESINNFIVNVFTPDNIMILLVIFLVLLAIVVICLIRSGVKENKKVEIKETKEIKKDITDTEIIKKIEPNQTYEKIDQYEKEQEKKAIISYEELLKNASKLQVDYEDDEDIADIAIHKVTLKESEKKEVNNVVNNMSFYSYSEEEEFLKKLKEFRANL